MSENLLSRRVRFSDFEVDVRSGELRKCGRKIRLQEKPFQILALLIEQPGELVTREEMRQKLWPSDTFVDFDHSLGTAISKLRLAFGDSPQNPRFIETVASRGYRFIAPMESPGETPSSPTIVASEQFPEASVIDATVAVLERESNVVAIHGTGQRHRETIWVLGIAVVAGALLFAGLGFWFRRPAERRTVTRLAIPLPAGQQLVGDNNVAMSPDGMNLVYAARQQGGPQLYLRSLESLEAVPIAGTEGGKVPFFSPDSQWIGFFAATKLKKVRISGGVVSNLCDSSANGSGANWGTDGRIYFEPQGQSGIWRVSAEGGTPEPVTTLDRQQGESDHLWPQLLPGGKAILFTVWTGAGIDDAHLAVQVLGTNHHRIVIRGASGGGRYVSSGHLVFVRGGTLMAVPFDLARLDVTAVAPVELVKGALEGGTSGSFSISAGGTLAYAPGPSSIAAMTRLVWVDRSGRTEPLAAPTRAYRNVSLSPDGRRVAIGTLGNSADIWIYDLVRNTLTRLSSEVGNLFPLWAPDNNRVTYVMFRHGTRDIYRRPSDGGGDDELLVANGHDAFPMSWSPDGRILAFDQTDPSTGSDLWTVDVGGDRKPHPFLNSPYDERFPEISPDGHWLAYESNESGRFEVYVSTFPVPGQKWQISTDGGGEPTWAHSGSELFYRSGNKMMVLDVRTKPNFAVGLPRVLFQGDYYSWGKRSYDVSPDGKRFLMLQTVGEEQGPTQINVVLNWFEELKQKVPTSKK